MKLSAKFYWEDFVNNWEIDYYNDLTEEEQEYLSNKLKLNVKHIKHCFYKENNDWCSRIGGMTFNIKDSHWYLIIKKHLDKELTNFIRKEKLKQIDGK